MKILLTGASGFIGRHITAFAEGLGHTVVPLARNVIMAPYFLKQTFQKHAPNLVIHCATYGNHYHHTSDGDIIAANYICTYNLLYTCANFGTRFIYFSSSSVQLPVVTLYSATKLGAEQLVRAYVQEHRLPAFVVRPSSVTGPGEQEHHLIPTLIRSCLSGEVVKFTPAPVHDFIDVHDVVRAVFFLKDMAKPGHIYNISRGQVYSNREVLDMVQSVMGIKVNTEVVDSLRSYDSRDWHVDNSELVRLGFKYNFSLMDSIERMVAGLRQAQPDNKE